VAACGLLLAADEAKEKQRMSDQEKVQGTWAMVSGDRNGKPLPDEVIKHVQLIFAGDKLTTKHKDRATDAKFKLRPEPTPKEIDLDLDGSVGRGIYDLEGDNLKILHGEVGNPRPTTFDVKEPSGLTLLVLKREKR
jgi:uncharacterized protein (TIGR03067 family)